jgi:hypothetical protein
MGTFAGSKSTKSISKAGATTKLQFVLAQDEGPILVVSLITGQVALNFLGKDGNPAHYVIDPVRNKDVQASVVDLSILATRSTWRKSSSLANAVSSGMLDVIIPNVLHSSNSFPSRSSSRTSRSTSSLGRKR